MKKPPLNLFLVALGGLLLVSYFSFTQGSTDLQDVYAINVLYTSLGLPPLTGWVQSAGDPCGDNWQGVKCVGPNITEIALSNLNLGGQLGYGLQNFTSLITLDLRDNHIGDVIPFQLPPHLQGLLLSGNQFDGNLPYSLSTLTLLSDLVLGNNLLIGAIPDIFQDLSSLINLDFSFNKFSGQLPASLSALTSLSSLHLQNNKLSGTIDTLANLQLTDLNVENNIFTGGVPPKLLMIPNFKYGGNQFSTSPASSSPSSSPPPTVSPHSPSSPSSPGHRSSPGKDPKSGKSRKYLTSGRIAAIAIAGLFTAIAAMLVIIFFVMRKRDQKSAPGKKYRGKGKKNKTENKLSYKDVEKEFKPKSSWMGPVTLISNGQEEKPEEKASTIVMDMNIKPPPIEKYKVPTNISRQPPAQKRPSKPPRAPIAATVYTVAALQQSTNSFGQENLIGEGSLGRVYRAELPDGKLLAIKKLDGSACMLEKDEDFLELVENISKLRHSNITELVGYCIEHGQHLLVYEYMSNGTLHEMLHSGDGLSKKLSWNARVHTALGAARALEYLHEICDPAVVHRNFKSANILLDGEVNPHLSDCGLEALTSFGSENQVSAHMLGSFGYSAPEFAMSGAYTVKSDVYSFGVVMLELLTGRKPLDSSKPRSEQSLVRWAAPQLHDIDALSKMVDPALKGIYPAESLSRFADIISLCVQPEPKYRPPISEVVQALVRLMQRATLSKKRSEEGLESKSLELPDSSFQE